MSRMRGPLVIIGGHEDKEGSRAILKQVAEFVDGGRLVIATVASHDPQGYFESYRRAFSEIGLTDLIELYVKERSETAREETLKIFDGAAGVFFSGGDQLRISSTLGDTPVEQRVREILERGGVVAGTSAGAAAMSDTMLVKGKGG